MLILIGFNTLDCKGREEANLAKKRRMRLRRIFCRCDIDHFIESFFAQTDCCRCRVSLLSDGVNSNEEDTCDSQGKR